MATMTTDDEGFALDDFDDDMDMGDNNDYIDSLATASTTNASPKKRKWRDAEEYREWKRLRDLLGDDDLEALDF
jgi:hypothetical protein